MGWIGYLEYREKLGLKRIARALNINLNEISEKDFRALLEENGFCTISSLHPKRRFSTLREAKRVAKNYKNKEPYPCPCLWWHIGEPPKKNSNKDNRRRARRKKEIMRQREEEYWSV